ncbi:MAG: hypothetical protein MPN21_07910 [Thermoanaerobaculia bacterium]|nr:hypothetical protein [Thermoanaerobaculia bacterium]
MQCRTNYARSRASRIAYALALVSLFWPASSAVAAEEKEPQLSPFQAVHQDLVDASRAKALKGRKIIVREVPEPSGEFDKEDFRKLRGNKTVDVGHAWERPAQQKGGAIGVGFSVDLAVESIDLNDASGVSGFFSTPPDTMGAVGPTEFFTAQNNTYRIHDKTTGASAGLDVADNDFWVAAVDPADDGGGDPRVRFDRVNDRWVLIAFDIAGGALANNRILIALSNGPTLNGATVWTQYFIIPRDTVGGAPDTNCFADYPMLGVDVNAIYIGANMFDIGSPGGCGNGGGTNTSVFVVPLNQLPGGGGDASSITTAFTGLLGSVPIWSPMPTDNFDPNATTGYILAHDAGSDTNLKLGKIANPGGAPGTPSLTWFDITVSNKNDGYGNGVPYPGVPAPTGAGTSWGLDPLGFRPLGGNMVRDGRLWTAMTSSVDGPSGDLELFPATGDRHSVVFFEVDVDNETLIQDGNVFDGVNALNDDPTHVYMGSVAVNGQGHAVVGATGNNTTDMAPSAMWAGRLASDPLGRFSEPAAYLSGTNTGNMRHSFETNPRATRWGDYSQVTVDPCDDMTFYVIQEYQDTPAVATGGNWGSALGRILAPAPTFVIAAPGAISGASTLVDVTGTGFYQTPSTGMPSCRQELEVTTNDPGTTVNSVVFNSPTSLTIDLDASGATLDVVGVTITNPDGQSVVFQINVADSIFSDGFESGNTTAWSVTVN